MKLIGFTPPSSIFERYRLGDSVFAESIEFGELPGVIIGKDIRYYWPFDKPHEVLTVKTFTHVENLLVTRVRPMFP